MRTLILFFLTSAYAFTLDSLWIEPLSCNLLLADSHCAILQERLRAELEFSDLTHLCADSSHAQWIAESRLSSTQSSLILQWHIREKNSARIVFSSSALSEDGWPRLADQGINNIIKDLRQYLNNQQPADSLNSSKTDDSLQPPAELIPLLPSRTVNKTTGKISVEPITVAEAAKPLQPVSPPQKIRLEWLHWTFLGAAILSTGTGMYYWKRVLRERDLQETASWHYDAATSQSQADQARADYLYHRSQERKALVPALIWSNTGIGFLYIFSMSFIWF